MKEWKLYDINPQLQKLVLTSFLCNFIIFISRTYYSLVNELHQGIFSESKQPFLSNVNSLLN